MPRQTLSQQLGQKLSQRINPRSVALGRILEMTSAEFDQELQRELDENPALEVVSERSGHEMTDPGEGGETAFSESSAQLQRADYADPDDVPDFRGASGRDPDATPWDMAAALPDDDDSLLEVVMNRLTGEHDLSERQNIIAQHIAGNLDSNGWLTRSLDAIEDEIALIEGFVPERAEMTAVAGYIRSLDPAGIGATDLRDCLLLQLERRKPEGAVSLAVRILKDNFDLFAKRHFERLAQVLGVEREELAAAGEVIRSLNPRPAGALGLGKGSDRMRHINPDFLLEYDAASDTFTLTILGRNPDLAVESSFAADSEPAGVDGSRVRREAFAFIRSKRQQAADFIQLADLRAQTLTLIIGTIVRIQHDFFATGDTAAIRPMILRDVAADTGLDISVISRATSGKYIQTPYGIYPLKTFFNEKPNADTDASAPQILEALAALIAAEDPAHPLSDRELTDAMERRGYDIARRTVAKYRERLKLPVARLRKKM